jgi:hypothetical protein
VNFWVGLILGAAAIFIWREGPDAAYLRGYDEGLEQGVWSVCREVGDVNQVLLNNLSNCVGF